MGYRVTRDTDGRPAIELDGEPAYCRALRAAPAAREPELDAGTWLVLAFAAWSAPDVAAVETALDVARRFGGAFQLGLRPFDDPAEHAAWWPGITGHHSGPLWLLVRDGRICMKRQGFVTPDDLSAAIEASLPCAGQNDSPA